MCIITEAKYLVINTGYTYRIEVDDVKEVIPEYGYDFWIIGEVSNDIRGDKPLPSVLDPVVGSIIIGAGSGMQSIGIGHAISYVEDIASLDYASFLDNIDSISYDRRADAITITVDAESG